MCRVCWRADPKRIRNLGEGYVPPSSRKGSCVHQLDVIDRTDASGERCECPRKWVYECRVHGQCSPEQARPGVVACSGCAQWTPAEVNRVEDVPAMVSIGSYGLPGMIALQLRMLRHHCGDVPILVSDDHSPNGQSELIRDLCEQHGATFRLADPTNRIGHSGGDLGAYYHALDYARERGIRVVCKLSQRFVVDRPRWLQDAVHWLQDLGSTIGTGSDRCIEGGTRFGIRSEAVLMRTDRWFPHRESLLPRQLNHAAEELLTVVARSAGDMAAWSLLGGPDRTRRAPGVIWHTANPESDYRALAVKFGVDLDLGRRFFAHGWHTEPDFHWG